MSKKIIHNLIAWGAESTSKIEILNYMGECRIKKIKISFKHAGEIVDFG